MVFLKIESNDPTPFQDAWPKIATLCTTELVSDQPRWVHCQALGAPIHFEFFDGNKPSAFDQSEAGRIFDETSEVRWRRDTQGCLIWRLREVPAPVGDQQVLRCRKRLRRQYLWGMYIRDGRFSEPRIQRDFRYPLLPDAHPRVDDRAYIKVVEYLPAEPEQWPEDLASLQAILNQPEIIAHRFMSVHCGRDEE